MGNGKHHRLLFQIQIYFSICGIFQSNSKACIFDAVCRTSEIWDVLKAFIRKVKCLEKLEKLYFPEEKKIILKDYLSLNMNNSAL